MAVLDGHHDAGDPTDPVGSALGKIVRALPEPVAAQAEAVRRTTAPAPDRAAARPDPGTTTRPRAGLLRPPAGAARLPLRGRVGVGRRGRPVGGRRPPRPVVPAVPLAPRGRPAGLPDRPGPRRRGARRHLHPARRPRPGRPCSRSTSPSAGSTRSRWSSTRRSTPWRRCLPRALGRLEPVDAGTTRLVGSTSNPCWYAEQLAAIPAPYRIVGGPELQQAARVARPAAARRRRRRNRRRARQLSATLDRVAPWVAELRAAWGREGSGPATATVRCRSLARCGWVSGSGESRNPPVDEWG